MVQPTTKRLVTEASVSGHVLTQVTVEGPTKTALAAAYVRFEDTDGNPLASRNVVIKVDATTGEIVDIVSEA